MLLRFRVTNHASLRDEQELSMIAQTSHRGRAELSVPRSRHRTVPVAAIYGPNASGKSNSIDAIAWMRAAVLSSFRSWDPAGGVPRRPFIFRRDTRGHPSTYVVEFMLDDVRYEFGFSVDDQQVLEEWLYSYPEGKSRRLYERHLEGAIEFGRGLAGRRKVIAELLRSNSLYLSVAAAQGHDLLGAIYRWFRQGLRIATDGNFQQRLDHTVNLCLGERDREIGAHLMELLRFADIGVSGLEIHELEEDVEHERRRLETALRTVVGENIRFEESLDDRVRVSHDTPEGTFALKLERESSGTRTWIGLLGPVITALAEGAVLCIDELDARLHPYLSDALVGMFQSPSINIRGAQLIFSTHEASLLGKNSRTELFRDQVWFTEMDESRATRLFPLTEFQVRDQIENLERRYLAGRYGAVPYLDEDMLERMSEESTGGGGATGKASRPEKGESPGAAEVPHLLRG